MTKSTATPTRPTLPMPMPMPMRSAKAASAHITAKTAARQNAKAALLRPASIGTRDHAKTSARHDANAGNAKTTTRHGAKAGNARTTADNRADWPNGKPPSRHTARRAKGLAGSPSKPAGNASQLIDQRIEDLADWRGDLLAQLRTIVKEVAPEIVEEWKWRGVPVWSCNGIVCTGETYKTVVKMTFAKGAALADPAGLFNSSLEGNTRRAIDFAQGAKINVKALKALLRDAVALNRATTKS